MSARPRDRAIYPVLINLANGNVRWSIAAAVKSLSTIQAIVNMQYWAPVSPRQVDDTSSISLNHVSQSLCHGFLRFELIHVGNPISQRNGNRQIGCHKRICQRRM